jgi:hypothetical protein
MTTGSLKMIRNLLATTTLFALLAGCGQVQPGEATNAIQVAQLPPVLGCDSVAKTGARHTVSLISVSGVDDLYLVRAGETDLCIDSRRGVHAMVLRLGFVPPLELAASNPMPGDDGSGDEAGSNPMPGDDGTASNPMPGENHKNP